MTSTSSTLGTTYWKNSLNYVKSNKRDNNGNSNIIVKQLIKITMYWLANMNVLLFKQLAKLHKMIIRFYIIGTTAILRRTIAE